MTRIKSYFLFDVNTHAYPNFNGGLAKPPSRVGNEWVFTSHGKLWHIIAFPYHNLWQWNVVSYWLGADTKWSVITAAAMKIFIINVIYLLLTRFVPSQWETALLCNDASHWLGASLESALNKMSILDYNHQFRASKQCEYTFSKSSIIIRRTDHQHAKRR